MMVFKKMMIAGCCFIVSMGVVAQSKKEVQVAKAVETLKDAMINGDQQALSQLTADQLSYGHSGGKVENKNEFVQKIVSGQSDFVTINITEQTICISGKTAIVRHVLQATTNDNNKPGEVHLKILLVWQKQSGTWKLLARQAVKMQ